MSIYDRLREAAAAEPPSMQPQATSYFSTPEEHLDPNLFTEDEHLKAPVRLALLSTLYGFWRSRYRNAEQWSRVWVAGSGASYQWSAARDPGDLDVLIGIDWPIFRRDNPDYRGLGDDELAGYLNKELHDKLWPETKDFLGSYESTFYINPGSWDITNIRPYAAYSLTDDSWSVHPDQHPVPEHDPRWELIANQDVAHTAEILAAYNKARDEVMTTSNPGLRLNSEITLRQALRRGALLFNDIHEGRKKAFAPTGGGYDDVNEYRYKSAKGSGVMSVLRALKDELDWAGEADEADLYGGLPDARNALIGAAMSRRYRG